ncbi:MAG: polyprenyl synthetase family protein [Cyclobacteriaceae bacterium]|nr:polyprenyl synthetase family protein [Cyclobacteriaceae bacterium]
MINSPEILRGLVNKQIEKLDNGNRPPELYDPIKYIMELGGKRLRPVLVLMSYLLYKDDPNDILDQAVAVEMFHNFSLVHDDIMDNAPLRRGKPTVHEKWNANTGILAGDVMLVKVYDLLLENLDTDKISDTLKRFNLAAIRVCEGQQLDMNFETRKEVNETEYIEMIRLKTAELLAFSLALGATLAGKKSEIKHFEDFGNQIGIGFQLKDDLLDAYGGEGFGKQVGGDIISCKKTFLTIKTLELASEKDRKLLLKWFGENPGLSDAERVEKVIALYNTYGIKEKTEERMNQYFEAGFQSLKKIDAPLNRKATLRAFTEALIERNT